MRKAELYLIQKGRTYSQAYLVDGEVCLQIADITDQSKRYRALGSIVADLIRARNAFEAALIPAHKDVAGDLVLAAVVTYMRCFVQSDGRRVKLENIDKYVPQKQSDVHLELDRLRDKLYAHADKTEYDFSSAFIAIDRNTGTFVDVHHAYFGARVFEDARIKSWLEHTNIVLERVNEIFTAEGRRLCQLYKGQNYLDHPGLHDPESGFTNADSKLVQWQGIVD